jgi:hypothetical protein
MSLTEKLRVWLMTGFEELKLNGSADEAELASERLPLRVEVR